MGKNKSYFLRPENAFLKFRIPLGFCVFLLSFDSLNAEKHVTLRPNLDPTFFLVQRNTSLSLGGLFEIRKKFPPSYGAWLELPFWKRDRRHFWKTFFLYENHRTLSEEISVVHRAQINLRYSFLSGENFLFPSVFVGWEKGQKDLAVFGIHLEIPERQSIQLFGKTGENFRNVSLFLHSPFDQDLRLFLGVSRTWNDSHTEDQFTLGIGISWEKLSFSFFGNRLEEEETSLTGKFGVNNLLNQKDNLEFTDNFDSKNSKLTNWKNRIESKNILDPIVTSEQVIPEDTAQNSNSISRYTTFSISVQELLSAGFPLSSALRISQKSFRSKKEFFQFLNSLPEKERAKVFVLLKKKNPILRKK
ncbi:hypothetical protein [Leptospira borgpetersenii]|uniref:hypothetical protein n=1 Tax=Leptospira borgpetersenii TaxID=174 RepID=UPI000773282A|nr:hypothetical protein [Leptospira borgpetersenii]MBE8401063.1 hypothetical protein [Leptospira borgpetersenii serovar Tarassovi]MBE8403146.1 hypothetical protein [Leptospira borgpetersenii serovar Tarassovi]MBE8406148.1 hypothetical protein [Leptospira borgpetersenii serovar Tarassovi]MBE8414083.1 hypothetical protein [Leptospira borgpetersenii serovar Tarassovi]MBE8415959.1 hypothetical protein [Leptospira borgpetersenii serovar Tarassovi]